MSLGPCRNLLYRTYFWLAVGSPYRITCYLAPLWTFYSASGFHRQCHSWKSFTKSFAHSIAILKIFWTCDMSLCLQQAQGLYLQDLTRTLCLDYWYYRQTQLCQSSTGIWGSSWYSHWWSGFGFTCSPWYCEDGWGWSLGWWHEQVSHILSRKDSSCRQNLRWSEFGRKGERGL